MKSLFLAEESTQQAAGNGSAQLVADLTSGAAPYLREDFAQDTLVGLSLPFSGALCPLCLQGSFLRFFLLADALFLGCRLLAFLFEQLLPL